MALADRRLPEKFFYWFPLSVRAWLALCREGPYRNYIRSERLVRDSLTTVCRALRPGPIEVVSLGSGQGTKDLHVLKALQAEGRKVTYVPVDAGLSLLEMACANAAGWGVAHRGVKADITNPSHLRGLTPVAQTPPRLIALLGNTLGAFDPLSLLRAVRGLMREDDLLLVDGELGIDHETRSGYENPVNRGFALAPLLSIGITESEGRLVFEPVENVQPGFHRLRKYFQVETDVPLRVAGELVVFRAGDQIVMSHSGKYERPAFLKLIDESGFEPAAEFMSDDSRFLMVLAKPR